MEPIDPVDDIIEELTNFNFQDVIVASKVPVLVECYVPTYFIDVFSINYSFLGITKKLSSTRNTCEIWCLKSKVI